MYQPQDELRAIARENIPYAAAKLRAEGRRNINAAIRNVDLAQQF
jgi:hypothetical protein